MTDAEQRAEHQRQELLNNLLMLARGFDISGRRVDGETQRQAIAQYNAFMEQIAKAAHEKAKLDQEKAKLDLDREVAHRKLDIDEEKVQVQKAEVMVKALEVAVNAGIDKERLFQVLMSMNDRLLPAPIDGLQQTQQVRQLEKKEG